LRQQTIQDQRKQRDPACDVMMRASRHISQWYSIGHIAGHLQADRARQGLDLRAGCNMPWTI
jgi:hypothetical protein